MKGWVAPAETLMGNMRFPAKFTLVSFLFLIPLLLTLVLYWQESARSTDQLHRELQGMKLIRQLEPVLIEAGNHRGLVHAQKNGDASVGGQLSSVRNTLAQHLRSLQQLGNNAETPASVRDGINGLQQQWQNLQASSGANAQSLFDAHNQLIKDIRMLFVQVSRSYVLELDSDAHTTFLIDMAVIELPALMDESSKLRDAATGIAAMGQFSPDTFIFLSNQLNKVAEAAPLLEQGIVRAAQVGSESGLQQEIRTAEGQLGQLQSFIRSQVLDPDRIRVSADRVFQQSSDSLRPMVELYDHMMPMLQVLLEKRLARLELHRNLVLGVILVTVGAAFYLFMGFYCYTIGMVTRFSKQAATLAAGNLSVRLEVTGQDEMRAVGEGFNQVAEGFQQLVRQTVSSTARVADAAGAMNHESALTLEGAAQQQREAEMISQAVAELAHSADDIRNHSTVAANSARQADEMATEGRNVVEHTAQSFTSMMDEVARTSEVMGQLDIDVQAIGDISRVIREIAEQTNLLALNAAIEAARAGEQGRGFAVVADEVRNLAQRTQTSTHEIQQTIESLQACTRNSVDLMTSTQQQVSANVEDITRAGELLGAIDNTVADMNRKNAQIATAVQAQNQLIERLQANIASVSDVADNTEGSARQNARLAQDMSASSTHLQESLKAFNAG
ncbi:MAG: methyl-accepting chemotaxis protein [Marinobacterium sp.]|nr:methyl-accepting chemotaxis protein [Marinobacterium sp.]